MAEHNSLAGALIFAHAAQDGEALMTALKAVNDDGAPALVMLALAATAANLLVELHGEAWPEAMRAMLLTEAAGRDTEGDE